jgi:hypothetical protein
VSSAAPSSSAGRVPPVPGVIAAALALMSALVPGFFVLAALGFSGGRLSGLEWGLLLVPLCLTVGLVVGSILLLIGRSWLALVVSAGALALLILGGTAFGGWAAGAPGFALTSGLLPAVAAVLAARPVVRGWVAGRRAERSSG